MDAEEGDNADGDEDDNALDAEDDDADESVLQRADVYVDSERLNRDQQRL